MSSGWYRQLCKRNQPFVQYQQRHGRFGYEQLAVVGKVNLTGTNLVRTGSFIPTTQAFTIINNDGYEPVIGTFTGLAEGATFVLSGVNYTITYAGGDGNDVVLIPTATLNATAVLTGSDLTITDTASVANTFRVATVGADLVITEANGNGFSSIPGGATLSADNRTMTIPQSLVTGTLTINASSGNDIIAVQGITGSLNLVIDGGFGTDTIAFGSSATNLTAGNISATAETINIGLALSTAAGTIDLNGNAMAIDAAVNAGTVR